jgi:hypothetical protein
MIQQKNIYAMMIDKNTIMSLDSILTSLQITRFFDDDDDDDAAELGFSLLSISCINLMAPWYQGL